MSSTLPIIDFSNHKAEPIHPFFSEKNPEIPPAIASEILDYFNAIELSRLEKVSWTWHVIIRTYLSDKIMRVKEFYLTHYKGQTFQTLTNKEVVNISEVESFLYAIPPELISRFAYVKNSDNETPLIHAMNAHNFGLMISLIESLPEDEREAYVNVAFNRAKIEKEIGISTGIHAFYVLSSYVKNH